MSFLASSSVIAVVSCNMDIASFCEVCIPNVCSWIRGPPLWNTSGSIIGLCIPADLSLRGSIVISLWMKWDVARGAGLFIHRSVSWMCSSTSLLQVPGRGSGSRFVSSCGPSTSSGHASSGVGAVGSVGVAGVFPVLLLLYFGLGFIRENYLV